MKYLYPRSLFINESKVLFSNDLIEKIFNIQMETTNPEIRKITKDLLKMVKSDDIERPSFIKPSYYIDLSDKKGFFKLNDQEIKINRLMKILLGDEYKDHYNIGDYFNIKNEINKYEFEEKSMGNIEYYYDKNNYDKVWKIAGRLYISCMNNKVSEIYQLYKDNSDIISILILKNKETNKIAGRALLWKTNLGTVMDVVYTAEADLYTMFNKYAHDNKYLTVSANPNKKNILYTTNKIPVNYLEIQIKKSDYVLYPYLDIFKYLDYEKRTIIYLNKEKSNIYEYFDKQKNNIFILNSDTGGYEYLIRDFNTPAVYPYSKLLKNFIDTQKNLNKIIDIFGFHNIKSALKDQVVGTDILNNDIYVDKTKLLKNLLVSMSTKPREDGYELIRKILNK